MLFGLSKVFPLDCSIEPTTPDSQVDMTPWRHFNLVGGLCLVLMVATFAIFSPLGLVKDSVEKNIDWGFLIAGLVVAAFMYIIPFRIYRRINRDG